jgi:hypothetical protein
MRTTAIASIVVAMAVVGAPLAGAQAQRASPHEIHEFDAAGCHFKLNYGRPSMRGRTVWGALVPWNRVWMPGADEATILETTKPIAFGELVVPAGQHTIYTTPAEPDTQLIISKEVGQWHTHYDATENLGQVKMAMKKVEKPVEMLTLAIEPGEVGGRFTLTWGDREYSAVFVVR